jgi:parallel beta-helix repeat protein
MNKSLQYVRTMLTTAVFLAGLAGTAVSASAQPNCGDTIGPNQSVTLAGDLGPCNASTEAFALKVVGPATLNLGGFTVECDEADRPDGIVIEGEKAKVLNGEVLDCENGIVIGGTGESKHKVKKVMTQNNALIGFLVQSDKNKLIRNQAEDNVVGFVVNGDENKLVRNVADMNDFCGFEIAGEDNQLKRNEATQNTSLGGFGIFGENNQLVANTADDNNEDGFFVDDSGVNTGLIKNTATNNDEAGFRVQGDSGLLKKNRAENNDRHGIQVQNEGSENLIIKNTALNNGDGVDFFDLRDDTEECDDNTWSNNTFGTSKAGNVVSPPCIN